MFNKDCEYASGGHCLCDACQSMRRELEEAEEIPKEELEKMFLEMDEQIRRTSKGN